jgi:hypothetical protein
VVVDDLQQQLDPSFVARLRERGQFLLRAEPPVQTREVVGPVAVVRRIGEPASVTKPSMFLTTGVIQSAVTPRSAI